MRRRGNEEGTRVRNVRYERLALLEGISIGAHKPIPIFISDVVSGRFYGNEN